MTRYSPAAVGLALLAAATVSADSMCYGTTSEGALRDGCQLPADGANFSSYSSLGRLLGRTWVHCAVHEVAVNAYADLASRHPDKVFVYGETGLSGGGRFAPHKTHQNGLSIDFMVPVVDRSGRSVPLPTGVTDKFGYNIEFDQAGTYDDLSIDFEALAAHIAAVARSAERAGVEIWRVIFDPKLQPWLHKTKAWPEIEDIEFSKRRSWVRHDEHYHIDFRVPCRAMAELK